jgi:membrane protein YqaA with SNARE-associated domain
MSETGLLDVVTSYGVYTGTLLMSFVSGLVPLVNSEILLLGLSATLTTPLLGPLALCATLGQMAAKTVCYFSGQGLVRLAPARSAGTLQQLETRLAHWEAQTDLLIFFSATFGVPPFYLLPFVAGSLRIQFWRFFLIGCVGRCLRFWFLLAAPQLVKQLWW